MVVNAFVYEYVHLQLLTTNLKNSLFRNGVRRTNSRSPCWVIRKHIYEMCTLQARNCKSQHYILYCIYTGKCVCLQLFSVTSEVNTIAVIVKKFDLSSRFDNVINTILFIKFNYNLHEQRTCYIKRAHGNKWLIGKNCNHVIFLSLASLLEWFQLNQLMKTVGQNCKKLNQFHYEIKMETLRLPMRKETLVWVRGAAQRRG